MSLQPNAGRLDPAVSKSSLDQTSAGKMDRIWSSPCERRPLLEVVDDWRQFPIRLQRGVLSIGNFDGVHRGHQVILQRLVDSAKQLDCPSIVFSFSPHPIAILRPQFAPIPLSNFDYRARLLGEFGVDVMVVCQTNAELLSLTYDQFYKQVIHSRMRPQKIVEGPNFYFGRQRQGNTQRLQELCDHFDVDLEIVQPFESFGGMISSSVIRRMLLEGNVSEANQMLGHRFELSGIVVSGDGRGKLLGVPTANLSNVDTLVPGDGVYAGLACVQEGIFPAAINIGAPVTFQQSDRRIEVHLIGYTGDLYDKRVRLQLLKRIRDTKSFDSVEELKTQIQSDIQATTDICLNKF